VWNIVVLLIDTSSKSRECIAIIIRQMKNSVHREMALFQMISTSCLPETHLHSRTPERLRREHVLGMWDV